MCGLVSVVFLIHRSNRFVCCLRLPNASSSITDTSSSTRSAPLHALLSLAVPCCSVLSCTLLYSPSRSLAVPRRYYFCGFLGPLIGGYLTGKAGVVFPPHNASHNASHNAPYNASYNAPYSAPYNASASASASASLTPPLIAPINSFLNSPVQDPAKTCAYCHGGSYQLAHIIFFTSNLLLMLVVLVAYPETLRVRAVGCAVGCVVGTCAVACSLLYAVATRCCNTLLHAVVRGGNWCMWCVRGVRV